MILAVQFPQIFSAYNSASQLLQLKDTVIKVSLSTDELDRIYKAFQNVAFTNFPKHFIALPFHETLPCSRMAIKYSANHKSNRSEYSNCFTPTLQWRQEKQFHEISTFISDVIYNKPEVSKAIQSIGPIILE